VDELLVELQNERMVLQEKLDDLQRKEIALNKLTRNFEQAQSDLEFRRKRFKMEMKEAALQQSERENRELEKLMKELKQNCFSRKSY
jgi:DNA mismatch repair protein MutS2